MGFLLKKYVKSVSGRILLSYLIISIGLILVMSFFISIQIRKSFRKREVAYFKTINSTIAEEADYLIKEIYQNGYSLFESNSGQTAMKSTSYTPDYITTIRNALSNFCAANSFADSVYFVNVREGIVFTSEMYEFSLDDFYDIDVVQNAIDSAGKYFVPRHVVFDKIDGESEYNYLTIYYTDYGTNNELEGIMVINIDQEDLAKLLTGNSIDESNELLMLDKEGIVISSSSTQKINNKYKDDSIYQKISASQKEEGVLDEVINNEKSLLVWKKMDKLGLIIIGITSYKGMMDTVYYVQRWIVVLSIIIIGIAAYISVKFTQRTYSPISYLISLVEKAPIDNEKSQDKNEYEYLTDSYTSLITKISHLSKTEDKLNNNSKKELVRNILDGSITGDERLESEFSKINVDVKDIKSYLVMVLTVDNFYAWIKMTSMENVLLLKFSMENIITELIEESGYICEVCNNGKERITVVLFEKDKKICREELEEYLYKVNYHLQKMFYLSCSLGIGNRKTHMSDIYESEKEALEASHYRIFTGYGNVIHYEDIIDQSRKFDNYPYEEEQNILNAVRNANNEKAAEALDKFYSNIIAINVEDAEGYVVQLVLALNRLNKMHENNKSIDFHDVISQIGERDSIYEKKQIVSQVIDTEIMIRQSIKRDQNDDIVEKVVKYLEDNYSNPLLSIEEVAEKMNISSSQMRKIFKDSYNIKPIDYLVNLRINKAKAALKETEISIKDIAIGVGYENIRYFYALFKKKTGMTCSEYRKYVQGDMQYEKE